MERYSGPFLTDDGFIQAEITVGNGRIIDYEEGGDSGKESVIIPTLYNSHTHMNDSVVKEPPEGTIAEVVGPGGLKHKAIENTSDREITEAIKHYIQSSIDNGTRNIYEFREGGMSGIGLIKPILEEFKNDIDLHIYGRPKERIFDKEEVDKILSLTEGLGLSAYRDWPEEEFLKLIDFLETKDKHLALHCSEDVREPIEKIMDLNIHHLIHMIEATDEDLELVVEKEVPIVICPRSNLHFGKYPNIPNMLSKGVTLALGTDNAMFSSPNMFREMETAYKVARLNGGVSAREILMMVTWNPRKALNYTSNISGQKGSSETYLVMKPAIGDPYYDMVTRKTPKDIIETVKW